MRKEITEQNTLRAEAEARLCYAPKLDLSNQIADGLQYELDVHKVELEMQNEELRRAYDALDESRDRYVDLYDFSPVGYLTITYAGLISEINLTAAKLLASVCQDDRNHSYDSTGKAIRGKYARL